MCALADLKMGRLLDSIDEWIEENGDPEPDFKSHRFEPTAVRESPPLLLDLSGGQIKNDYLGHRLSCPIIHGLTFQFWTAREISNTPGGVVDAPGMYVMGLPFFTDTQINFDRRCR